MNATYLSCRFIIREETHDLQSPAGPKATCLAASFSHSHGEYIATIPHMPSPLPPWIRPAWQPTLLERAPRWLGIAGAPVPYCALLAAPCTMDDIVARRSRGEEERRGGDAGWIG